MNSSHSSLRVICGLVICAGCGHSKPVPTPVEPFATGAGSDSKSDAKCTGELPSKVRSQLADAYSCGLNGYRCIDGHNGRAFVQSGYLDGNQFYTKGVPGASIQVNVFATAACAETGWLDDLVFTTHTIKNPDSRSAGGDAKPKTENEADTKKDAKSAVADAQADVKTAEKTVGKKVDELKTKSSGSPGINTLTMMGSVDGESLVDQLVKTRSQSSAADAPKLDDAINTVREETSRARDRLHELDNELADIKGWSSETADTIRQSIAAAGDAASHQDWPKLSAKLDDIKTAIDAAKPERPQLKGVKYLGTEVVVRDYVAPVPDGDDNQFFTISVSRVVKDQDGKDTPVKPWPTATLSVKVDHGRYSFEGGFLFAGVRHGERFLNHRDGMDVTACPDACRWATQGMLAGSFFFYRHKLVAFDRTTLIPGIQAGINSDVTKFADAFSLGAIWEPITGIGISAGVMRYSRAASPYPNSDNSFQQEKVWLPYVGLTINSDILDTMKGLASAKDKAGNAKDKD